MTDSARRRRRPGRRALLGAAIVVVGVAAWALVDSGVIGGRNTVQVALFGDSLSSQTAPYLAFILGLTGRAHLEAHTEGGTAVCDWLPMMRQVASTDDPQAVVLQFSGNALTPCMHGYTPLTPRYWQKYAQDMSSAIGIFTGGGARVYVIGYPITRADVQQGGSAWDELNQVYGGLAAKAPGRVRYVDAGTAVEGPGGTFTTTLPCLATEQCTGPVVDGVRTDVVRSPDGSHFCPTTSGDAAGRVGTCPTYSSGAFRYAAAIAAPIDADFHL